MVFRPFAGAKQAERMVAQARLIAFPDGGKPFLKAREGMAGLGGKDPTRVEFPRLMVRSCHICVHNATISLVV